MRNFDTIKKINNIKVILQSIEPNSIDRDNNCLNYLLMWCNIKKITYFVNNDDYWFLSRTGCWTDFDDLKTEFIDEIYAYLKNKYDSDDSIENASDMGLL